MRVLMVSLVLTVLSSGAFVPAFGGTCAEGSIDGKCVDARLAHAAREGGVIATETRLSVSSHNYPPSQDWQYAYPNDVSGAMAFGSGRAKKGAAEPVLSSAPALVYGIRN